jgi:tetratricopeptide (TPR) repeat protein
LTSLEYVPDHSPAINTLAIINRRAGNLDIAEKIYRYGIQYSNEKLSLLKNYYFLLESLGRTQDAETIQNQLAGIEDPSPFHWVQLARSSYDEGEYLAAIRFYNQALDRAPYLHEAWLGIAQANYEIGRYNRSRSALRSALEEAEKVSTRKLYEAKLVSLTREMSY